MRLTEAAASDPDKACRICDGTGTSTESEWGRTITGPCAHCFGTGTRGVIILPGQPRK